MKYFIAAAICLIIAVAVNAQTPKVELLDLVKELAGDSAITNTTLGWPKAGTKKNVKWKSYIPKKEGNNYVLLGTASVVIKGKALKCSGGEGEVPCKWDIILSGKKTGYTYFTASADGLDIDKDTDMIAYFFGKGKLNASLIEKAEASAVLFWNYKYQLQIPGKRDIWMKITYENRTATASQAEFNNFTDGFYIDFFLNKKDLND